MNILLHAALEYRPPVRKEPSDYINPVVFSVTDADTEEIIGEFEAIIFRLRDAVTADVDPVDVLNLAGTAGKKISQASRYGVKLTTVPPQHLIYVERFGDLPITREVLVPTYTAMATIFSEDTVVTCNGRYPFFYEAFPEAATV